MPLSGKLMLTPLRSTRCPGRVRPEHPHVLRNAHMPMSGSRSWRLRPLDFMTDRLAFDQESVVLAELSVRVQHAALGVPAWPTPDSFDDISAQKLPEQASALVRTMAAWAFDHEN